MQCWYRAPLGATIGRGFNGSGMVHGSRGQAVCLGWGFRASEEGRTASGIIITFARRRSFVALLFAYTLLLVDCGSIVYTTIFTAASLSAVVEG